MKDRPVEQDATAESLVSDLRELQSECAQLSELDEMELTYASKLVDAIKILQSYVDAVIPLRAENLVFYNHQVKQATLASEGVVVLSDTEGKTMSLPLSKLKAKDILAVVQDCTPELRNMISERRKATGARVELLERIMKDLKKASSTLKPTGREESPQEDLIRNSITTE